MPGKRQLVRSLPETIVNSIVCYGQRLALIPLIMPIAAVASPAAAQIPDIGVQIQSEKDRHG